MNLSDLAGDVRRRIRNVPDFVILDALQHAASEFYNDSGAWRATLPAVPLALGQAEYDLDLPNGARVCRILSARLGGGGNIRVVPESTTRAQLPASGKPSMLSQVFEQSGAVVCWPTPATEFDAADSIVAQAVLAPVREATEIPDAFGERHRKGLVAGALEYLAGNRSAEWHDPALAGEQGMLFASAIQKARTEAESGLYAAPMKVAYRPWI